MQYLIFKRCFISMLFYYIIDDELVQPIMANNEEEAREEIELRFGVNEAEILTEARYKREYSSKEYKELPTIK